MPVSAAYVATGTQSATTPAITTLSIMGATTRRAYIFDFTVSSSGTPVDQTVLWTMQRFDTDDGTGSAVAEVPLDNSEVASQMTATLENHTAEPTYVAGEEVWENAVHVRSTFRHPVAQGAEFIIPAVATEGFGWASDSQSYTGAQDVTVFWFE